MVIYAVILNRHETKQTAAGQEEAAEGESRSCTEPAGLLYSHCRNTQLESELLSVTLLLHVQYRQMSSLVET